MGVLLDSYQIDAVNRLRSGSILCGGVGSGKSRTALSYYLFKECKGRVPLNGDKIFKPMENKKDLYIITTAKKRDSGDWERECSMFTFEANDVKVIIDSWNNIKQYCNICNAFFIFDEQRVVGSGEWVKSFLQIAKKNHWILLSATPGDTWLDYIPVFIANGFYKNRSEFIREHVVFNRFAKFPKVDKYVNVNKLIFFRNSIMVCMDYKNKHDIHTDYIKVEYDQNIYDNVVETRWNIYTQKPIKNKSEYLQVLRKIVNSDPKRLEATEELIKEVPRLIIFYNYDYELDSLRKLCRSLDVIFAEWNGHKHMPIPNSSKWVYLVQYTAGAEGWECTTTNTILFYSLNYSYRTTVQARGRVDRFNTPYSELRMIHLISNSSIDKTILKCLNEKRDFNLSRDLDF